MSAPQDNGTTNAGADPESTSQVSDLYAPRQAKILSHNLAIIQTADDTPPPSTQGLPPLPQPGYRSPDDPIGNPDPIPIGYFLDPNAPPGTYDHIPGIYSRQSMQERSDILFKEMLRRFEQATDEADEAARTIATELLRWSGLPLLFRAFAHVGRTIHQTARIYYALE